jgi:hypothetical protein
MKLIKSLALAIAVFIPSFLVLKAWGEKTGYSPAIDWSLLVICSCLFLAFPSLRNQGVGPIALSVVSNAIVLYFLAFYLMLHFFGEGL